MNTALRVFALVSLLPLNLAYADAVNYETYLAIAPASSSSYFDTAASPTSGSWFMNALQGVTQAISPDTNFGTGPAAATFSPDTSNPAYVSPADVLETPDFKLWLGQTNPGTAFGSAYANENGNQLVVITVITPANPSTAATFSLANVGISTQGGSPSTPGVYDQTPDTFIGCAGDTGNAICRNTLFGYDFGDQPSSSTVVDAIVSFDYYDFDILNTSPAAAEALIAGTPAFQTFTQTLSYSNGNSQTTNVTFVASVPEPATIALLGTGLLALMAAAHRRTREKIPVRLVLTSTTTPVHTAETSGASAGSPA